jgi:hypothetical protein
MKKQIISALSAISALIVVTIAVRGASPVPRFEFDPSFPQMPAGKVFGDVSSVTTDGANHVWVIHRPRTVNGDRTNVLPPVVEFDETGRFVNAWGGPGAGFEWPEREHGIFVDANGDVWVSGNNGFAAAGAAPPPGKSDDMLLKFTRAGKFLVQFGHPGASKGDADNDNVKQAADMQIFKGELFVADGYGNHRVIVVDADTGKFKRMWGAFGNKPVDDYSCAVVSFKEFKEPGPQNFSIVHAIRVSKDGIVYVADRENRRVQMFDKDGKFIKQLMKGDAIFARDLAFSPDEQFLYVGYGKGIAVVDRKTLDYLGTIEPPGILGAGHHIQTDSKGNIYIAQTSSGMQRLTYKGMSPAK